MLSSIGVLQSFKKIYKKPTNIFWLDLPFHWHDEHPQFRLKPISVSWKLWELIFSIPVIMSMWATYRAWSHGEIEETSTAILVCFCTIPVMCSLGVLVRNRSESATFFNGMLQEEQTMSKIGHKLPRPRLPKLVVECFVAGGKVFPLLFGIVSGMIICKSPNMFADLNDMMGLCGSTSYWNRSIGKWIVFLIQGTIHYTIWLVIFQVGNVVTMHIYIGCLCMKSMMALFVGIIRHSRIPRLWESTLFYRKLQILSGLFNTAHVRILFCIALATSMAKTCVAYVLFESVGSNGRILVTIPFLIWNVLLLVQTILIMIVIYGLAGSVYEMGKETLHKIKVLPGKDSTKMKEWKRIKSSFLPPKVAFGLSNFVEVDTSLKFVDFSIQRFVDILLLRK